MWWYSSSGQIELHMTLEDAEQGSHPGQCADDVAALRKMPHISKQLNTLEPSLVAAELDEYGAWNDEELADHDANLNRLLWIACCDLAKQVQP